MILFDISGRCLIAPLSLTECFQIRFRFKQTLQMLQFHAGTDMCQIFLDLSKRYRSAALAVAPPVFAGTFVFIAMMVAGLGAMCASLGIVAARMKKKGLIVLFVLTFLCYMAMGYLASRDGSSAAMNWIEQGVNTLGQALLLCGVVSLHRAGLRELDRSVIVG